MKALAILAVVLATGCAGPAPGEQALAAGDDAFVLRARRGTGTEVLKWKPSETAVIICDMWDTHSCKGAAARVARMAPYVDRFAKAAREKGALIIHAPSDTMKHYEGTPGRELAKNAPAAPAPMEFKWRVLDPVKEVKLPIDDRDWCDCPAKCDIAKVKREGLPWRRQIDTIEIREGDAISQSGQEIWNLMAARGIRNVVMTGVHTNMCVLGRPFGIRQLTMVGKNVVLARDLTDGLYDPQKEPKVTQPEATQLIVGHIEKHWCPSILSSDVTGKPADWRAAPKP